MTFEVAAPVLIFLALLASSFGALALYERLPRDWQHTKTLDVIHAAARLFVIMTSLVLGFMMNSAKNTYEAHDHNIHAYATQMILLDKTLQRYGPDANDMRQRLRAFAERVADAHVAGDPSATNDKQAEQLLTAVGNGLNAVMPSDPLHLELWHDAQQQYQKLVETRLSLIEQSQSNMPPPLIAMLGAWLMLIFTSFGYRAPRNPVVAGTMIAAAALVSGAIYLILDMGQPHSGPIQVSSEPLERVIAELGR
jgi:predicted urease superfamily metal-dependent hydrolase